MATLAEVLALGLRHHQAGDLARAEELYRQVLQADPAHLGALHLLGVLGHRTGNLDLAFDCLRQALALKPAEPTFHSSLGLLYEGLFRFEEAVACYRQALALDPGLVVAHYNLGNVLQKQGNWPEAVRCYQQALRLEPHFAEAHSNLGCVRFEQGRLDEAVACHRRALALKPGYAEAYHNLAAALTHRGEVNEALLAYRRGLALNPADAQTHGSLLLTLNYQPGLDRQSVFAEHLQWARQHAAAFTTAPTHANDRTPDRPLCVGYLSADFREHPVAGFIEPVLAAHDRARFHVTCYSNAFRDDPVTRRLRGHADAWRDIAGLSDDALAALIRADATDVLVDLAGHTGLNRLLVFARGPAPVQVTYLGYPNTTGLSAIDYRLTDAVADPPGEPECHSEELWRLPGCFCCYAPPEDAPAIGPPPAAAQGPITFGSLHHLARLNDAVARLWAAVLNAVPGSRLLVARHTLRGHARELLRRRFHACGVGDDRLELRAPALGDRGHLGLYAEIDVTLDTLPWSGHTTACESLWMGVPALTLLGDRHAGRMVASVLDCLGLADWVARTPEEFVARAGRVAGDRGALAALRGGLRQRLRDSALCDGAAFTRRLEEAYRQMWQRWCGRPG